MTLKVFAPAKINLSLRVGPPQSDGRHPLDSLVGFTCSSGDQLSFEAGDGLHLIVNGPFCAGLSAQDDNLVLRAARLLRDHSGSPLGATITLTKHLPIASGIGGGSADAAAALIGLNQLWNCGATRTQLQALGARLGADVPACVLGQALRQALRMTGTGETICAVPALPQMGIVMVNPLIDCPTGSVYHCYDRLGYFSDERLTTLPNLSTIGELLAYLRETPNDLEAAAITEVPEITNVLAAICATPDVLLTRMSGSGATCFGLYQNLAIAQQAAVAIKNALASHPVWVEADEIN